MDFSKLPAWLFALSLLLILIGFIISLYGLKEPRFFVGVKFGPIDSANLRSEGAALKVEGQELPSNGGNVKSSLCPENSYMVGVRYQSDQGGKRGMVSSIYPVCRSLEVSMK